METKNYFKDDSISYSMLSALSIGPAYFKKKQEEEQEDKEHFIIGSLVDTLLTEPSRLWEIYALEFQEVCEKVPTGQMKEYTESYVSWEEHIGEPAEAAYNSVGFKRKSDTCDAIYEKFVNECNEYYNWLRNKKIYESNIGNKQIITNSQYSLASDIVKSLKTNRFTRKYFEDTLGKNIEVIYQLEIYWEFKGQKCKSKLDLVIIDHNSKEIQILDIKTTGNSPFSFILSSLKWNYHLQASFYSSALYWLLMKSNHELSKYKDYKILPFKFIVESSKYPGLPLIYQCSDKFLTDGMEGFYKDGRYYKGFKELVDEYIWYKENNSWDYPREIIENEGIIKLEYA